MKNIYTWAAKPAKRTLTVGDLKAAKGKRKFTQVTANNVEEAEAAEKANGPLIQYPTQPTGPLLVWESASAYLISSWQS